MRDKLRKDLHDESAAAEDEQPDADDSLAKSAAYAFVGQGLLHAIHDITAWGDPESSAVQKASSTSAVSPAPSSSAKVVPSSNVVGSSSNLDNSIIRYRVGSPSSSSVVIRSRAKSRLLRSHDWLDSFVLSAVPEGSPVLWIAILYVYALVYWINKVLRDAHEEAVRLRSEWLRGKQFGQAATVCVMNVDPTMKSDQQFQAQFTKIFGQKVIFTWLVKHTTMMNDVLYHQSEWQTRVDARDEREAIRRGRPMVKDHWLCQCCLAPYVFATDFANRIFGKYDWAQRMCRVCPWYRHSDDQLQDYLNQNRSRFQRHLDNFKAFNEKVPHMGVEKESSMKPAGSAQMGFVMFNSLQTAAEAVTSNYSHKTEMLFKLCPDPNDVRWYLSHFAPVVQTTLDSVMAKVLLAVVFLSWHALVMSSTIMVSFSSIYVQSVMLTDWVDKHPRLAELLQGFASTVCLKMFLAMLPSIFHWITLYQGTPLKSLAQLEVQHWSFIFDMFFILLVTGIGSGLLSSAKSVFEHPVAVLKATANSLPDSSTFYMSFCSLHFVIIATDLARIWTMIKTLIYRIVFRYPPRTAIWKAIPGCDYDRDHWTSQHMGRRFSLYTMLFGIGIVFTPICPFISPLMLLLAFFGQLTYSYLIVFCDIRQVDSGGAFWPVALQQTFVCVIVMELVIFGVLSTRADLLQLSFYAPIFLFTISSFEVFSRKPWDHVSPFDVTDSTIAPPAPRDHEDLNSLYTLNPAILRHHMQRQMREEFCARYVQPSLRTHFLEREVERFMKDKAQMYSMVKQQVRQFQQIGRLPNDSNGNPVFDTRLAEGASLVKTPVAEHLRRRRPVLGPWMGPDCTPIGKMWDVHLNAVEFFVGISGCTLQFLF